MLFFTLRDRNIYPKPIPPGNCNGNVLKNVKFAKVNIRTLRQTNNSVTEYHSIPKINWGSFQGRRQKLGDHFGSCTLLPNML